MSRREEYFEAMLRDLGSVYYQTLQGEASADDVARAVETVRAHEAVPHQARRGSAESGTAQTGKPIGGQASGRPHQGRWRVADVMSTNPATVDKNMPYKQVAQLLAASDLTAVPVVSGGGRVLGMVSEADVLRKEERSFARLTVGLPRRTHREREQADALTAAGLMTSPAITIHPDAPLGAAARLMNGHHIRRLPVVDPAGQLLGMVSRRDLLSVFLRPDEEIGAEITEVLASILLTEPGRVTVTVIDGVVTLTGELPEASLTEAAVRLASDVDGVVAVSDRLTAERVPHPAS